MNMYHDEVDFELKRLQDLCREKSAIIRQKMGIIEQQAATIARLSAPVTYEEYEQVKSGGVGGILDAIIQERLNNVE